MSEIGRDSASIAEARANPPPTASPPATRERPPDVARHAATKAVAAIVDFDELTLAFKAEADALCHAGMIMGVA
jgi:hypothetical protein